MDDPDRQFFVWSWDFPGVRFWGVCRFRLSESGSGPVFWEGLWVFWCFFGGYMQNLLLK